MPSASTNILPFDVLAILAGVAVWEDAIDAPRHETIATVVNRIVLFTTPLPALLPIRGVCPRYNGTKSFRRGLNITQDRTGYFQTFVPKTLSRRVRGTANGLFRPLMTASDFACPNTDLVIQL
jgi:hypothetical protein